MQQSELYVSLFHYTSQHRHILQHHFPFLNVLRFWSDLGSHCSVLEQLFFLRVAKFDDYTVLKL
jgi:hypothetical protein